MLLGLFALALPWVARNGADPDLWGYLCFGRLFFASGSFPFQDVFSYLPTKEMWVYHEWLTGVLFYALSARLGGAGLHAVLYLASALCLFAAYKTARLRGAGVSAALQGLVLAVQPWGVGTNPVRAQVFTYLFFAVFIYLLERARVRGRYRGLCLLVPIMILWANLHGGFLAGLGMVGLYGACAFYEKRPWRPCALCLAACALATAVNPYGFGYWPFILKAASMPRPEISEWLPALSAFSIAPGTILVFLFLVFFTLWLAASGRLKDLTSAAVLFVTAYLAFSHWRHLPFFGLAFMALVPPALDQGRERERGPRRLMAASLMVMILCMSAFISLFQWRDLFRMGRPWDLRIPGRQDACAGETVYPVDAVAFLKRSGVAGNVLTDFEWGEYMAWTLFPRCLVGVDGRYETVFPERVMAGFFDYLRGRPGWRDFLDSYPHEIVVTARDSVSEKNLSRHPEWIMASQGTVSTVFLYKKLYFSQAADGDGEFWHSTCNSAARSESVNQAKNSKPKNNAI